MVFYVYTFVRRGVKFPELVYLIDKEPVDARVLMWVFIATFFWWPLPVSAFWSDCYFFYTFPVSMHYSIVIHNMFLFLNARLIFQ